MSDDLMLIYGREIELLNRIIDTLEARLEEAEEVIEFYAEVENQKATVEWISTNIGQMRNITTKYDTDSGTRAREYLAKHKGGAATSPIDNAEEALKKFGGEGE